jgi:nucleotide-binding universal stress UspA family protein
VERAVELFEEAGAASVDVIEVMPDPLQLFFNVRDVVIDLAKGRGVDLIVMGTRGQSDWQALRIGSTASSVTRYAEASMLLANASRI